MYTGLHDKTNQKYLEIRMRSTSEKSTNAIREVGKRKIQTICPDQTLDIFFIFFLSSQGGGKKEQTRLADGNGKADSDNGGVGCSVEQFLWISKR
jgi:hypothetical protein